MTKHGCPPTKIPIAGAPGLSAPAAFGYNKCPHECVCKFRELEWFTSKADAPLSASAHLKLRN
jgi:hypothetical protein